MDLKSIKEEAYAEVDEEHTAAAKEQLKALYKEKKDAELIVKNIDLQIKDLEISITDGTFDPDTD